jgi:hypothetical protein
LFLLSTLCWILHEAYDLLELIRKLTLMEKLHNWSKEMYIVLFIAFGYAVPLLLVLICILIEDEITKMKTEEYLYATLLEYSVFK